MAWVSPTYRSVGDMATAARWNELVDAALELHGNKGTITLINNLIAQGSISALNTSSGDYSTNYIDIGDSGGSRVRMYAQKPGANPGGQMILSTLNASGTLTEAVRVTEAQHVGIGTYPNLPASRLHLTQGNGHALFIGVAGLAGTTTIVAPAGTVPNIISVHHIIRSTDGSKTNYAGPNLGQKTGAVSLYNNDGGVNNVALNVNSDGSLSVQRSAGSLSWNISMWILMV